MSTGLQKKLWKDFVRNIKISFNEPLSRHTTFNIGGPARLFIKVPDEKTLKKIVLFSQRYKIPYYVIGNGSNLLVNDKGINAIVIKLESSFKDFAFKKNILTAGAGASLSVLRKEACRMRLSGLEFTAGIPGTIGGAIKTNAGAGSCEVGGIVRRVRVMNKDGRINWSPAGRLNFGYRHISIKKGSIIVRTELKLKFSSAEKIREMTELLWKKRRKSQPAGEKSAGCIFKNPYKPDPPAGFLIEKAGLKGVTCGGAVISRRHANFIVNKKNAKAEDVNKLIKMIQRKVSSRFGVKLEPEIERWYF